MQVLLRVIGAAVQCCVCPRLTKKRAFGGTERNTREEDGNARVQLEEQQRQRGTRHAKDAVFSCEAV
jgi:hypothetical protein